MTSFEENCDSAFGIRKCVTATEQISQKGRRSSPAIEWFRPNEMCFWAFELWGSQWACSDVLLLPK